MQRRFNPYAVAPEGLAALLGVAAAHIAMIKGWNRIAIGAGSVHPGDRAAG